jgi:hypothetical protein
MKIGSLRLSDMHKKSNEFAKPLRSYYNFHFERSFGKAILSNIIVNSYLLNTHFPAYNILFVLALIYFYLLLKMGTGTEIFDVLRLVMVAQ